MMAGRKAADRPVIMSVPQVAARWKLAPCDVYEICVRGELPHHRIAGLIRIRFSSIEHYEKRKASDGPA
jgi:hypothetical protein